MTHHQITKPLKILIIGPSWVGDMVMAQSLFMVLKQQHPDCLIDVLAPAWSRSIIERMPEINKAIDMPLGHGRFGLKDRWALGKALRKQGYAQSINLPNSWKSALIPWFANIPVRTGWKGEARYGLLNDLRKLDKGQLPMMVQRFVALAYPALPHPKSNAEKTSNTAIENCPPPSLLIDHDRLPALLQQLGLNTHKPTLILCPGAEFGPAKQWPAEHYSATATHMIQVGYQVWIMGASSDIAIADAIYSKIKDDIDATSMTILCGKTSLEEAIDLLSVADKVVSNDSGLMHIASALNKPLVALYGATSPAFTPPLSPTATIVSVEVDCGPCFKRECPKGHHKCMNSLSPESVVKALNKP
jgi:heptosyltransferase-2